MTLILWLSSLRVAWLTTTPWSVLPLVTVNVAAAGIAREEDGGIIGDVGNIDLPGSNNGTRCFIGPASPVSCDKQEGKDDGNNSGFLHLHCSEIVNYIYYIGDDGNSHAE